MATAIVAIPPGLSLPEGTEIPAHSATEEGQVGEKKANPDRNAVGNCNAQFATKVWLARSTVTRSNRESRGSSFMACWKPIRSCWVSTLTRR